MPKPYVPPWAEEIEELRSRIVRLEEALEVQVAQRARTAKILEKGQHREDVPLGVLHAIHTKVKGVSG